MAEQDRDAIRGFLEVIFGDKRCKKIYETLNSRSLSQASYFDLISHGIPRATATKVKAIFDVRHATHPPQGKKITQSSDTYSLVKFLGGLSHEEFWVIYLNQGNKVIHLGRISSGGTAGTIVDMKMIFKEALRHKAPAIILVHNHPSGNLNPSQADIAITKKIKEGGEYLDIQVLDHILVAAENGYVSFADDELM